MALRIKSGSKIIAGNKYSKTEESNPVKFNIAELTLLYNIVIGYNKSTHYDVVCIEDILDYITDKFYSNEFDIEDELWIEYKGQTKSVGRADKYNLSKDRNDKRKFIFSLYELYLMLELIQEELRSSRKNDEDFYKIAKQLETILSAHLYLIKCDSSPIEKINCYPDFKISYIINGQTFYVDSFSKFAEILEKRRICESAISTITKTITFILNA